MKSVQMLSLAHNGNTIGVLDMLSPKMTVTKLINVVLIVCATSIQICLRLQPARGHFEAVVFPMLPTLQLGEASENI